MSFTKEDILARLQNGESADAIANEMATILNEAAAEKKALDEEASVKAQEETRVLNAKRAAIDDMLDALCDYLVAAGEGEYVKDVAEIETDKMIEMIDDSIAIAKNMEKLKGLQFPLLGMDLAKPRGEKKADSSSVDAAIGDFLKSFGL